MDGDGRMNRSAYLIVFINPQTLKATRALITSEYPVSQAGAGLPEVQLLAFEQIGRDFSQAKENVISLLRQPHWHWVHPLLSRRVA